MNYNSAINRPNSIEINGTVIERKSIAEYQQKELTADERAKLQESIEQASQGAIVTLSSQKREVNPANIAIPTLTISEAATQKALDDELTYQIPVRVNAVHFSQAEKADELSLKFADQSTSIRSEQRVAGAFSRIDSLLEKGETSYEQNIRRYQGFVPRGSGDEAKTLNVEDFQDVYREKVVGLSLKLETADGDTIKMTFDNYQGFGKTSDGVTAGFHESSVKFEFSGELSKAEKEQLAKFTEAFDKAAAKYLKTGEFKLEDLKLTEQELFSQVELSVADPVVGKFSLSYSDNEESRNIKLDLNGHKSKIDIDKTSLGAKYSQDEMTQAREKYLELLDKSWQEVKGNSASKGVMFDIFSTAFDNIKPPINQVPDSSPIGLDNVKGLIPLPDFDFSMGQKTERPNAEDRPDEKISAQLKLSLKTDVFENPKDGSVHVKQQQNFDLSGSYYSPVGQNKAPDFDTQTYKYTEIKRQAEKITEVLIDDGAIQKVISTQESENSSFTQTYVNGTLTDEDRESYKTGDIQDLTDQAKQDDVKQQKELLETLIIDPYKKPEDERNGEGKFYV